MRLTGWTALSSRRTALKHKPNRSRVAAQVATTRDGSTRTGAVMAAAFGASDEPAVVAVVARRPARLAVEPAARGGRTMSNPPTSQNREWDCSCGYSNIGPICTHCGQPADVQDRDVTSSDGSELLNEVSQYGNGALIEAAICHLRVALSAFAPQSTEASAIVREPPTLWPLSGQAWTPTFDDPVGAIDEALHLIGLQYDALTVSASFDDHAPDLFVADDGADEPTVWIGGSPPAALLRAGDIPEAGRAELWEWITRNLRDRTEPKDASL